MIRESSIRRNRFMNFYLTLLAFAVVASLAAASENLRHADVLFTDRRARDLPAKFMRDIQNAVKSVGKSGFAKLSDKALKETYKDFYLSAASYPSDTCAGAADLTTIFYAYTLCWAETIDIFGVSFSSAKFQATSSCSAIQYQVFQTADCSGDPFTVELPATFDESCNGMGLVVGNSTNDDDDDDYNNDNAMGDFYAYNSPYCGWDIPSSTVPTPQLIETEYQNSLDCSSDAWVVSYINAKCYNYNGGGSFSVSHTGLFTYYTASNCQGTGYPKGLYPFGCFVEDDDDNNSTYSLNIEYKAI